MLRQELVVETFALRQDGAREFGSGYLIAPRLVLTAAHAVVTDGVPSAEVGVRFLSDRATLAGRVAWWCPDDRSDVALVEVTEPTGRVPEAVRVRWGRLTGTREGLRCEAMGFPRAQRGPDDIRDTEHLSGTINPGTRAKASRHDVLLDSWPESAGETSGWAGVSGAAVFCGDLLTGVLVIDPEEFASRRLRAVPVAEFLGDPGFVALVGERTAESVELAPLFEPEAAAPERRSPAYLLRADAESVPFHDRAELLADLSAWCEATDAVPTWLITAAGGQGKTRLAREFAWRRRAAGWIAGWLRSDDADHPLDLDRLAQSAVPVLVIVDYAEARTGQIERLVTRIANARRSGSRIRLLLLARHAGEWWNQLAAASEVADRALARRPTELTPLGDTADGRPALFTVAAEYFARALRGPGDQSAPPLPAPPPDLAQPRYSSVLTLHMTALVALLQSGPEPVPEVDGDSVEDVLLRHEERYWGKTATARGLRFGYSKMLSRAVSVATLFSAATETEAARLLGMMPGLLDQSEDRRLALAEWLHDLYPATDGNYWGRMQPDRLGEHLVARVVADSTELFDGLFAQMPTRDTPHAFEVLSRVAPLQQAAADTIARVVSARPELAPLVVVAATRSDYPYPLITAIEKLTDGLTGEPAWLDELIMVAHAASPSLFGRWSVRMSRKLIDKYRDLARAEPTAYQPKLATQLSRLAEQLASVGEVEHALEPAEEAVALCRALPDGTPADLAPALARLAGLYSRLGQTRKAVATMKESVDQFDRQDPPDLQGTVQSLSNLSAFLKDDGDRMGSLRAAQRALDIYRRMPDPDPWLTIIATSAGTNKANRLMDFGDYAAGLAIHREVVEARRRITQDIPGIFDNDLASGLHNLAKTLGRMGDAQEALPYVDESISIYRRLARQLPAVYRRNLADTLGLKGAFLLDQPGMTLAAVESLAEAEQIAIEIDDRVLAYSAARALKLARRRFPWVKQHLAQRGRPRSPDDPSVRDGGPRPENPEAPNTARNQPKRRSRRDRKKK